MHPFQPWPCVQATSLKESGALVEWSSEENYIFRLSSFKDDLLHWLQQTPARELHLLPLPSLSFYLPSPCHPNARSPNCALLVVCIVSPLPLQFPVYVPLSLCLPPYYCPEHCYIITLSLHHHPLSILLTLPLPSSLYPLAVYPNVAKETVQRWVESTLTDLSVSRPRSRLSWGIPVPNDSTQTVSGDSLYTYIL